MAKKQQKTAKLAKMLAISAFALGVPAAATYASTVQVSVTVAAVADVSVTSEEKDGEILYTATVKTNSVKGYDLYISADGEDWGLIKSVDHYPTGDDLVATSVSNRPDLKFKVEPRQ